MDILYPDEESGECEDDGEVYEDDDGNESDEEYEDEDDDQQAEEDVETAAGDVYQGIYALLLELTNWRINERVNVL